MIHKDQMIIEAGWGLGEAIVSGAITPDSYVVSKKDNVIIDVNVSEQERMLVRSSSVTPISPSVTPAKAGIQKQGKTVNKWTPVARKKRDQQKLTGKQIIELSDIVENIEKHYGFPCDIEWAFSRGKFYITQSRPITTLT